MARIVTATLVVDFADTVAGDADDRGLLQLAIDDREDGLNGGRTSGFYAGQPVAYLLYKSSDVSVKKHVAIGGGSIGPKGTGSRLIEDEAIVFSNSDSATLQYPVSSGLTFAWQGSTDADGNSKSIAYTLKDENVIQLAEPAYGLATATYTTSFSIFRLASVPDTVSRVMILAIGKA